MRMNMKQFLTTLFLLLSSVGAFAAPGGEKLHDYDTEISMARDVIENVRIKLDASKHLFDTNKSATKLQENRNSLEAARHWSKIKECRSASREFASFLDLSQKLEAHEALEAQKQLAMCYHKMKFLGKAMKFYRLYISTYTTSREKDERELIMVLENLFTITREASLLNSKEVKQLISALSTLSYQKHNDAKVQLWSAKLAETFGFLTTASEWYEQVYERQENATASTKIEALYSRSLLLFKKNKKEASKDLLRRAMRLAKEKSVDSDVYITMARLYVYEQSYNLAFEYYQKVPEKDSRYGDSLVESVYVALRLGKSKAAMAAANTFRKKFPERPEAVTLGNLRAYFALQADNMDKTSEKLRKIDKEYSSLAQWIRTNFAYLDAVPQRAVERLIDKTQGNVETTSTIGLAKNIFDVVTRNENELYAARNDLRYMIYVLGRSNLETLHPSWQQKVKELKNLSIDLLGSAHRLIASELEFLAPVMDVHDRQKIQIAVKKRMELYTHKSMQRYKKGAWINWLNYERAVESLTNKMNDLALAKAKLASSRLLVKKKNKELAFLKTMTTQLYARLDNVERYASKGRELARKFQIKTKLELAEFPAFKRFFMGYANSTFEEERTMQKYRVKDDRFAHNEIKKKFKLAWKEWEFAARLAFLTITQFEDRAEKSLNQTVMDFDRLLDRYERQMKRLTSIRENVEQILAKNIKGIVRQYELDISEKRARIKKWHGDLKWLGYDSAKRSQKEIRKKYLLEKEILGEAL